MCSPPQNLEYALRAVRSEVAWFRDATRTSPNLVRDGYNTLWQRFHSLQVAFECYRRSLTPAQQSRGANELAELSAGLDIIREAFDDYRTSTAPGQRNGVPSPVWCARPCRCVLGQRAGSRQRQTGRAVNRPAAAERNRDVAGKRR